MSEFYVFVPEQHDEPRHVKASTKCEAAEDWVRQFEIDCCEYPVASGKEDVTVYVLTPDDYLKIRNGSEKEWIAAGTAIVVSGEAIPSYYSKEMIARL